MTKDIKDMIGRAVQGTYYDESEDFLYYSSHDFPAHRITVSKKQVENLLQEYTDSVNSNARAD